MGIIEGTTLGDAIDVNGYISRRTDLQNYGSTLRLTDIANRRNEMTPKS